MQGEKLEEFLLENNIDHKTMYESLGIKSGSYYNALSNSRKDVVPLWIKAFNLGVKMGVISTKDK